MVAEVLWAPLFVLAQIAVLSLFPRATFFPLRYRPLLRRETDLISVLIRPTAEALVSPGILRHRASWVQTLRRMFAFFTLMYVTLMRTHIY